MGEGGEIGQSRGDIFLIKTKNTFFSRPSPKAGRELHIDRMRDDGGMMDDEWWTLREKSAGAGRQAVSLHRDCVLVYNIFVSLFLCVCFFVFEILFVLFVNCFLPLFKTQFCSGWQLEFLAYWKLWNPRSNLQREGQNLDKNLLKPSTSSRWEKLWRSVPKDCGLQHSRLSRYRHLT